VKTLQPILLSASVALCLAALRPSTAAAQGTGTVTCESNGNKRVHCSVSNLDTESVTMDKKLSKTNCFRDQNWGVDNHGIWVSGGCRAIFAYARRSSWNGGNQGSSGGRTGSITCASQGNDRNYCAVPGIDPQSVTMGKKLSQANCYRDESWGVDSRGIWVDQGCRATFDYATRSGGHGSGNSGHGASESSIRQACTERAARDWSVTESNLDITNVQRQDNGSYRISIQSKRTSGTCMVDRNGNVYNFFTN